MQIITLDASLAEFISEEIDTSKYSVNAVSPNWDDANVQVDEPGILLSAYPTDDLKGLGLDPEMWKIGPALNPEWQVSDLKGMWQRAGYFSGPELLGDFIESISSYLYDHHSPKLYDINDPPLVQGPKCTIPGIGEHLYWNTGELNVVVGPYGCGKSSLTRLLAYEWLTKHSDGKGLHICAWEDHPNSIQCEFASYLFGRYVKHLDDLSASEIRAVRNYQIRYYKPDPDAARTFTSYFEHVEQMAGSYANFIFDPWN